MPRSGFEHRPNWVRQEQVRTQKRILLDQHCISSPRQTCKDRPQCWGAESLCSQITYPLACRTYTKSKLYLILISEDISVIPSRSFSAFIHFCIKEIHEKKSFHSVNLLTIVQDFNVKIEHNQLGNHPDQILPWFLFGNLCVTLYYILLLHLHILIQTSGVSDLSKAKASWNDFD